MRDTSPLVVAFDLDGTLVDSAADLHAISMQVLAEHGLGELPLEATMGFIGHGVPPLVERSFAAAGKPLAGSALAAAVERYKTLYAEAPVVHSRAYPGVVAALGELRTRGILLAVCTNKLEALSRAVLDGVGLGRYFELVVGGDTLPVRKPDPAMLRHVAQRLGASLGRLVFVGDSETDAATADAAGVPLLLFTRGYRKSPVEALAHAAAFDDFARLPELVASIRLG